MHYNNLSKLLETYRRDGMVVVEGVFSDDECDMYMDQIISAFEALDTGIDRNRVDETWTDYNLPPQTRPGLFQALMSNIQCIWDIRANERVLRLFKMLYEYDGDYIVSNDGINIRPNWAKVGGKDWPHVDQTIKGPFMCVQGQVILTNTSASFRCTPGSHLVHDKILDIMNIHDNSNWCRIDDCDEIRKLVGEWQIPIVAPKGSMILWSSALIHSARQSIRVEDECGFDGWRGVVYVSYRPRNQYTKAQLARRSKIVDANRVTNHWGTRMFPKTPGGRYLYINKRHPFIEQAIKSPTLIYDKIGKPSMTSTMLSLSGH